MHIPCACDVLGGGVKSGYTSHTKPDLFVSRITPVPEYWPKLGCVVFNKLISEDTAYVGTDLGNRRNVSKHEYLREAVPTITVVDRDTTPKNIIKAVQHKLHHKVSYKAARKVLRSLQGTNIEAEREQFYCNQIDGLKP